MTACHVRGAAWPGAARACVLVGRRAAARGLHRGRDRSRSTGYEPSKLEAVKGSDDLKRVTFTAEGARRIGLRTARCAAAGGTRVVPYAALLYDADGKTYVYTSPSRSRSCAREVAGRAASRATGSLLSGGPPAGTEVVTVGAAEVYGAELEIAEPLIAPAGQR